MLRIFKAIGKLYLALLWGALLSAALFAALLLVCAGALSELGTRDWVMLLLYGFVYGVGPVGVIVALLVGSIGLALGWAQTRVYAVIAALLLGTAIVLAWVWLWPQLHADRRPAMVVSLVVYGGLAALALRRATRPGPPALPQSR